jgi:GNAT superfamily N-acetyltransferase
MNNSIIKIRQAVATDVPAILGFIRALAEYEKLTHACIATENLLHEHLFGPAKAAEVLIAELNGKPVAFALFFGTFSTFLARPGIYLEDLFVLPEARGHGIGKALLSAIARIAVQRNCGRLEWAVLDWNDPAVGFYKKLGAAPLDDWTTYRVTGETLEKLSGLGHAASPRV